ncbi:hypothetical protein RJ45_18650 [Photobacterium gaetbulicola]|uniref:Uncharacterized protein n=1 Tax=Photobacterium gaetbulicola TaxID=1295392 RepID=A0A0B9GTU4_9GAMM|nr:hypothetical protein [Photobacterium gaetbulicola]KHT62181.1 hypothetical protein RJ45_18650 [Photobacterium gaetbulicola]
MKHLTPVYMLILFLASADVTAQIQPTSEILNNERMCRLDIYHLIKSQQNTFTPDLQIAVITNNAMRTRYVDLKTDITHPTGFENFHYYRSGSPVEVFTTNWRNNGTKHTVGRFVMLGATSDKQAFDVFTALVKQDGGHFELRGNKKKYQFNAREQDVTDFLFCVKQHYRP